MIIRNRTTTGFRLILTGRKLKQRLKEEGNETVTNCHAFKLVANDGKKRLTDTARALARICDMSESQMLQYKAGIKKISPKNIARINEKLRTFAAELGEFALKGA